MKILLIDIETAPHLVYAWGLFNQNIPTDRVVENGYTLCWAAKWYGEEGIMFQSIYEHGKEKMLQTVYHLIDEADAVIHYNGTKFDMPTLNQEFLLAGYAPPSPVKHIDLLKTARQRFRLPSNRLNYVCEYLGLGQKVKHKGMELWRDCMAGDAEAWDIMRKYNIMDVVLLEKVYEKLLPWISNHPNYGLFDDSSAMVCPNCGSHNLHKRGFYDTQTLRYQRYQCQDCRAWSKSRTTITPKEQRPTVLKGIK